MAGVSRSRLVRAIVLVAIAAGVFAYAFEVHPRAIEAARKHFSLTGLRPHREAILFAARESDVDPYLIAAVVRAESSGRIGVVSTKGALGLMQLMPATAAERARILGLPEPDREELLADPKLNLRLGANYMAWLLSRQEGDVERALVAYNTGPTRLARWIEDAGSYAAWRAERRAAGNSDVLAFADRVLRYRDELRRSDLFDGLEESEGEEG